MVGRSRTTTPRMLRVVAGGEVLVVTRGEPTRRQKYADLSLGGMFIESLFPEDEGTKLKLDLRLEGFRLRLPAQVVWSRAVAASPGEPAGMGVVFQGLTAPQRKLLYSELARGVQSGQETKGGTPPAPTADWGLRSLLSRLKGK